MKKNFNEFLFNIYFWMYTIFPALIPNYDSHSTLILAISLILILILSIIYNFKNFKFKTKEIICYFVILIISMFDVAFRYNSYMNNIYIYLILFGIIPIYLYSRCKNKKKILEYFQYFSIFIFIIYFLNPFNQNNKSSDYMTYGFNILLPCFLGTFLLFQSIHKKLYKTILFIICLIVFISALFYANKSTWISMIIFAFIYYFIYNKKINFNKIFLSFTLITLLLFWKTIAINLYTYSTNKGIDSYSLRTVYNIAISNSNGLAGRDVIWARARNHLNDNLLFGNGAGYYQTLYNGIYVHNIVYDIILEYGLVFLIIVIIIIIEIIKKIIKGTEEEKKLGLLFFSLWFPKLMFSYYFQAEKGFWLFIICGLLIENNTLERDETDEV